MNPVTDQRAPFGAPALPLAETGVSALSSGSQAFLQQAYRNNWQRYLASLPVGRSGAGRPASAYPGWDACILTASDRHQAEMVTAQLEWRRSAGLLPAHTRFLVVADPGGKRIGSGGATLRILAALYRADGVAADDPELAPLMGLGAGERRILVIHSGGDSRRLPHCSATGKLFARIPHVLPDGRASTIFDEFLVNLSGVPASAPPGVLLVAGDVLLVFDHLQLSLRRSGVTGIAVASPAEMGARHGVYLARPGSQEVQAFLHKASLDMLVAAGAVDATGQTPLDTGLVWLDGATAARYAALVQEPSIAALCVWPTQHAGDPAPELGTPLNLYGDLLLPLAPNTTEEAYLADASDGPATPALVAARRAVWRALRGLHFSVEQLRPAVFVHFGSSSEYWRMVTADPALARICDWSPQAAAWVGAGGDRPAPLVAINALVELDERALPGEATSPLLVVDSRLAGGLTWQGRSLVAGVQTNRPLTLAGDWVVHQLPVANGSLSGFVTRVLGLYDDPKRPRMDPRATICNQPWADWLATHPLEPAALWPGLPPEAQTLWTARLFPVTAGREESLQLALALASPEPLSADWIAAWLAHPRLSLAESFAHADSRRLLQELAELEDEIAACRLLQAIEAEEPAATLAEQVSRLAPGLAVRRLAWVERRLDAWPPLLQLRGYKALGVMGQVLAEEGTRFADGEDRAFGVLARLIEEETRRTLAAWPSNVPSEGVRVEAAARIDFGGGWTDTPPYSIERGGTVLNAAVTLRGRHPIVVEASWLPAPVLLLDSGDLGEQYRPATVGELLAYANPGDPFALVKAALVMHGLVPDGCPPDLPVTELMARHGRGLRLATQTNIPRGSGLGTSSIMAGAVLTAIATLCGRPPAQAELFDQVLCLEQMLTTGGGWQDQAGGLVGGIHLVTSRPGLPQQLQVTPTPLTPATAAALRERLLLVYTGQQRLAKNLLRAVMGRWLARDPEMVWLLGEIARLACAMEEALKHGALDDFGALLGEHWTLNKRMDPGCSNPFIDELFAAMSPYMAGGKLAGAGGGGFAMVIAHDADAAGELGRLVRDQYAGTPVSVWPCAAAETGLVVQRY